MDIVSLEGIKYFTSLAEFHCVEDKLVSLDVSEMTSLVELNCNTNGTLTELNVAGCANLETLHCNSSGLKNLDTHGLGKLSEINCYWSVSLEKIDVTDCTSLSK